jgi:hypothetical protein
MFWVSTNKQKSAGEPILKHRFLCEFVFDTQNKTTGEIARQLVKTISAPSINIDFERGYANQHVHYFQNGSIHWEPIQIVFYDIGSKQKENVLSKHLFKYLESQNIIRENRTKVINLPIFCSSIKIQKLTGLEENDSLNTRELIRLFQNGNTNEYQLNPYFTITNPRINKIDFGSFDYGSDEINTITLTVIPEWCTDETLATDKTAQAQEAIDQAAAAGEDSRSANPRDNVFTGVPST